MPSICVYCSSSNAISEVYPPVAEALGREIAHRGHTLVYGGGAVGLMGVMARAAHEAGGNVTGVIPSKLQDREGIAYEADELLVTETMRERKKLMYERADAFVVLPGGYGTLEEFMEVLTLKQLGYHDRPIAILNVDGFYDTLLDFFEELREGYFAREAITDLAHVVTTPEAALNRLDVVPAEDGLPS
ncbi:Rossman fold protein, TIGR00730 family [Salinibacter sp. 10B]|uniref:LOG family protein n=1 Tax=Salinibacter sp. 10B TaxID=1923971 RepID=UPI000CF4E016|nr:TIGR00730 family Rossman fold protein [Salinibacter sp. 10B]PQJ35235.1 Rossman fold protein, TIGR00730 family [Salinibacter sp. 10B]